MTTEAATVDKLTERLRDVGFSERAVTLIVEQVDGLREESGLSESASRYELERLVEQAKEAQSREAERERAPVGDGAEIPAKDTAGEATRLVDPDLPVAGAGLVAWLLVLLSSWTGLTCEARLVGVGDLEILAEGCAGSGPGLLSFAGLLVVVWLVAPAAWNLIASRLRLPRPSLAQSVRAAVIWAGFSLLLVTTLLLASIA